MMIRIKCSNPNCSSPTKTFEWDETTELGKDGALATPHERGAVRVVAVCIYCNTENIVWVKGARTDDTVWREIK